MPGRPPSLVGRPHTLETVKRHLTGHVLSWNSLRVWLTPWPAQSTARTERFGRENGCPSSQLEDCQIDSTHIEFPNQRGKMPTPSRWGTVLSIG